MHVAAIRMPKSSNIALLRLAKCKHCQVTCAACSDCRSSTSAGSGSTGGIFGEAVSLTDVLRLSDETCGFWRHERGVAVAVTFGNKSTSSDVFRAFATAWFKGMRFASRRMRREVIGSVGGCTSLWRVTLRKGLWVAVFVRRKGGGRSVGEMIPGMKTADGEQAIEEEVQNRDAAGNRTKRLRLPWAC